MTVKNSHRLLAKSISLLAAALIAASALLLASSASAIEFDEVRDFDEVFVISAAAPSRDRIEVSWAIEDGYYLYNNRFLRFTSASEGAVLGEPQLPKGKISYDELLGEEVEKYHRALKVTLPLLAVAADAETVQ